MEISISGNEAVAASKKKYKALPVKRKARKQSGVIPYRMRNGTVEVMLVSRTHSDKWGIPKGGLESDMSKKESAANEAFEEAGLVGKVKKKVGSYKYIKGKTGRQQTVNVYAMKVKRVLNKWLEDHRRERRWFTVEEAQRSLPNKFKPMLEKIRAIALSN